MSITPDVIHIFQKTPGVCWNKTDPYWKHKAVNMWCLKRGLLPKDSDGQVVLLCGGEFDGLRAEMWGGTCHTKYGSRHYVALKFVDVKITNELLKEFFKKFPEFQLEKTNYIFQ